jgi:hypothetical protein
MKYAIILGRGVEGCGVTKCAIEAAKSLDAPIYASSDKIWARRKLVDFPFIEFPLGESVELTMEKAKEITNNFDVVLIFSVPSITHPEKCQAAWRYFVDGIKKPKILAQFDHKKQSLNRNAHFLWTCNQMDLLLTHSLKSDFALWLEEYGCKTPLKKMTLGFDFDGHRKKYWLDINLQESHLVRWIGRSTGWKGPQLMIDFHNTELRKRGFITILEGLEASIGWQGVIAHPVTKQPMECVNKFRARKELSETAFFEHGEEELDQPAYLYPPYVNDECMDRMAYSAFGSDLYHLKERMYGDNIENCHAEIIACGAIPIFHLHFGLNVYHRKTGNLVLNDKDNGTIFLESFNYEYTAKNMEWLKNNPSIRDTFREKAFEYWKAHADISIFHKEIEQYSKDLLEEIYYGDFDRIPEFFHPAQYPGSPLYPDIKED